MKGERMITDQCYCASSYLMYRMIADREKRFFDNANPRFYDERFERKPMHSLSELEKSLRTSVEAACKGGKAALALSGGIDSAIIARMMPKGSTAYTFRCVVPGIATIDEVEAAQEYASICGLRHQIINVYWENVKDHADILMRYKGAPIHSIETQIYEACLQAKNDGFETIIFGESCDLNYGGLSGLLSRDWIFGEFIDRYSYVKPYYVLKNFQLPIEPLISYVAHGFFNVHEFCRGFFYQEAMGTYTNACDCAGLRLEAPYARTWYAEPLDLKRIRGGENKYLIRELFQKLYPSLSIPEKLPMPRPMNEWLADWEGPKRVEFLENCIEGMTGDQKWMIWALERFLDLYNPRT